MSAITVQVDSCQAVVTQNSCYSSSSVSPAIIISQSATDWGDVVVGEIPSGSINGSNTSFSLSNTFMPNKLWVYLNGLRLAEGDISSASGTSLSLASAPISGDILIVDYIKS